MHTAFIIYKSSRIHYSYSAFGTRVLLCLHGYGESEAGFHFLEPHLPPGYQLIAIDFPFHGKTEWKEGLDCTITDLLAIIESVRSVCAPDAAAFTLLGFSMGGRLALQLLQTRPTCIEKVVLLAPDGLKINFWYWFSTQTYLGNKYFLFTMKHPYWFFFVLRMGNRLRLINPSILKFVRHYIHDKPVRMQLYNRWTCFRSIKPDLTLLKKIIPQHQIPVRLLYGQYDRIIRHERGEKFRDGIESFCTLQVIPTGHQLLQEKHADVVIRLIQS